VDQVNQNTDSINDIEHRLVDGLTAQEHLIDEIHDLQASEHTIKKMIIALAVAVVLSLAATGLSIHAALVADDAVDKIVLIRGGGGGQGQHQEP